MNFKSVCSIVIARCLVVICVVSGIASYGNDDIAKTLPQDTVAYFDIPDAPEFLSAGLETETLENLLGLPAAELLEDAIRISQDTGYFGLEGIDSKELQLSSMPRQFLQGRTTGVIYEDDGELKWLLILGLKSRYQNLLDKIRVGKRELAKSLLDGADVFEVEDVYLTHKEKSIVIGNDREAVAKWDLIKGFSPAKPLILYRKHRLISKELEFESVENRGMSCYVNGSRLLKHIAERKEAPAVIKAAMKTIEAQDLLGLGFKMDFPETKYDFDIQFYLLQGLPRRGFNQLFQLKNTIKPKDFTYPEDVDFATIFHIDFEVFHAAVNHVDELIQSSPTDGPNKSRSRRKQGDGKIMRAILNYVPMLAAATTMREDERKLLSGKFDLFGWLKVKDTFRYVDSASGAFLIEGEEETRLENFNSIPGMRALQAAELSNTAYLTWSKEMVESASRARQMMIKQGLNPPEIMKQVLTIADAKLSFFRSEDTFKRILKKV